MKKFFEQKDYNPLKQNKHINSSIHDFTKMNMVITILL